MAIQKKKLDDAMRIACTCLLQHDDNDDKD
jgi:hypothetical protein